MTFSVAPAAQGAIADFGAHMVSTDSSVISSGTFKVFE